MPNGLAAVDRLIDCTCPGSAAGRRVSVAGSWSTCGKCRSREAAAAEHLQNREEQDTGQAGIRWGAVEQVVRLHTMSVCHPDPGDRPRSVRRLGPQLVAGAPNPACAVTPPPSCAASTPS